MVPYSEFEIKADDARGHRVRITFKDGRKPVEGYCSGFSRALDCDPEIAEIDVVERATERGVSSEDIVRALTSPLKMGTIKTDEYGRRSRQYIGEHATVAVNPDTGATVSVWPTHSKIARKLLKEQGEQ